MKIINSQTIYDIAIQHYSNVDAAFAIFQANESLFVDGFTTELSAGSEITLPIWKAEDTNIIVDYSIPLPTSIFTPQIGMSFYDIALANYGSANEVFELAKANGKSITSILSHLDKIDVPNITVSKPRAKKYFIDNKIIPNSRVYPNRLSIEVINLYVVDNVITLEIDVLNEFPYAISTMLKFDFDEKAVDLDNSQPFTDAFDFGVDLPMPDAAFTYDTREINDLQAFQKVQLTVKRAVNENRFVIIAGINSENLNPEKKNNIFFDQSIKLNY